MDLRGDADEDFEELVTARWEAWSKLAMLLCGNRADAEDCVQSLLTALYARWPRVRKVEHLDAYARKMLTNLAISGRRRRAMGVTKTALAARGAPVIGSEREIEERLELWQRVRALPPRQRAVIVLRYYEDLSVDQTAAALGCSSGTVKSQTADALRKLGKAMAAEPGAGPQTARSPKGTVNHDHGA